MGLIDAQLDGVAAGNRAALARVYDIARKVDPTATEGESYGMAALLHRGKGYVAALEAKAHLGLYPFSGSGSGISWSALNFNAPGDQSKSVSSSAMEANTLPLNGYSPRCAFASSAAT